MWLGGWFFGWFLVFIYRETMVWLIEKHINKKTKLIMIDLKISFLGIINKRVYFKYGCSNTYDLGKMNLFNYKKKLPIEKLYPLLICSQPNTFVLDYGSVIKQNDGVSVH